MTSRRSVGAVAFTAAVLALSGACSNPNKPGLRTEALQADIVFGVENVEHAEATSAVPADIPAEIAPEVVDQALSTLRVPPSGPFQNRIPDRFKNVPFTVTPEETASADCPRAPLGAAPDAVEPDNASAPPREGLYRYRISGTRTFTYAGGAKVESPLSGFQPRLVRNVKVAGKDWTYETVEPTGDGGVKVITWSVKPDATQQRVSPPYVGENPVRVSEPDGGLSVAHIDFVNANGNVTAFSPASPVTYQQLPVLVGQDFTAVGVDPRTGRTLQVQGQPTKRQTVDACGTLIDGWASTLAITDARGTTSDNNNVDIVVSNARGAVIVSEHTVDKAVLADGTQVTTDLTVSLGQIEPSPIPANAA